MPEVVLKDYLEEINRLVEESHLEEAIGHCRHILKQFPRHVETYRLLGKALLEKEDYAGATDVFQRVLSADPEDFIAHAGIAIIRKQENRLREAAWHMERAFEVEPYNAAIREALQDMIGRRDGLPPERLSLTRGALARIYVRGELYAQAIGDLRQALVEEPDRVDLQLLLAEALWRDGQRIEAADDCARVIDTLPDCVKANAILAEVCLVTDRPDVALSHLRRVFELTLPTAEVTGEDSAVGIAFAAKGSPRLPEKIMVERANLVAGEDEPLGAGEWINDLDFGDEIAIDDDEPKWLGVMQEQSAEIDLQAAVQEVTSESSGGTVDDIDESEGTSWFSRSADQLPGIGAISQETDWESWLEHEKEAAEPVNADLQVISSEVEEAGMGAMDDQEKSDEFPEADDPQLSSPQASDEEGQELDWLDELQEAAGPEQEGSFGAIDDELPDWLREDADSGDNPAQDLEWLSETDEAATAGQPQPAQQGDSLPDWLRNEMALSDDSATGGDDLSWLDQIAAGEGAPLDEPPTMSWPEEDSSAAGDSLDDWDDESLIGASESPEASSARQEDDLAESDWWDEVASEREPTADAAMDDVPEDLDEAMVWLEQLAAQQGAPPDELPSLAAAESEDGGNGEVPSELDEAMDWLDELARADEGEEFEPLAFSDTDDKGEFPAADEAGWLAEMAAEDLELGSEMDEPGTVQFESGIGRTETDQEPFELQESPQGEPETAWDLADAARASEDQEEMSGDAPEDLDEAMAWLESLAAQQGAPLDELPSLQRSEAEEVEAWQEADAFAEAQGEQPAEQDEAMRWLEELASGNAVDLEGLPQYDDRADIGAVDSLGDIPDDPEQALAWLEGLADEAQFEEQGAEAAVVEEEATPPVPHDVVAARAEAEAILAHGSETAAEGEDAEMLEDIPDDPDEAMAWLERLAARQGAPLDELPSLADEERAEPDAMLAGELWDFEDVEGPVAAESEEVEEYGDVDAVEAPVAFEERDEGVAAILEEDERDSDETEGADDSFESEEPAGIAEDADVSDEDEPFYGMEMDDEELEDGLPDWLALDDEDDEALFDWDEAAFDATGWLEAESLALEEEQAQPQAMPEEQETTQEAVEPLESFVEKELLEEAEPEPAPEPELEAEELEIPGEPQERIAPMTDEPEAVPSEAAMVQEGSDGATELEKARQALSEGRVAEALPVYQSLLEEGKDLPSLIAALETASEMAPDQPAVLQTLGDAYNRNGQLQKALDAYRRALALL